MRTSSDLRRESSPPNGLAQGVLRAVIAVGVAFFSLMAGTAVVTPSELAGAGGIEPVGLIWLVVAIIGQFPTNMLFAVSCIVSILFVVLRWPLRMAIVIAAMFLVVGVTFEMRVRGEERRNTPQHGLNVERKLPRPVDAWS
jgi:hypothetical protein